MDKVMLILGPPYKHTVTFKLGLLFIYIRPQYEYEMDHKYAKGQRGRSGQAKKTQHWIHIMMMMTMMCIRQYKSLAVNQASSECAARAKTHLKVHVKVIQREGE
jgi:hypothetical protein